MKPHIILRIHTDLRSGLGQVARTLVIQDQWRAMGGTSTIAVSGDGMARRLGEGRHPFLEQTLDGRVVDLGEDLHAPIPEDLKAQGHLVLVDQWGTTHEQIQGLRPLKVALMEDDGDAHELADLLFQPLLEGCSWPSAPVRTVNGRKVRPCETRHGECRVLRGSEYVVVGPEALRRRPRREVPQPLSVRRLLVTFGGSDGADLAGQAFEVLRRLASDQRWMGTCTVLAPGGLQATPFKGCTILESLPGLTGRLPEFDAVWCSAGVTLTEALCMGVPVAAWGQDDRQHGILADMALRNGCLDLGVGAPDRLESTYHALEQWLGPEGQDSRQEQSRDGMLLVDGQGAARIAQELWNMVKPALDAPSDSR